MTPSSLKFGLYSSLKRFRMPSSSFTLARASSRCSMTSSSASRSSSTRFFDRSSSSASFPPLAPTLATFLASRLSASSNLFCRSSLLASSCITSLLRLAIFASVFRRACLACRTSSALFTAALSSEASFSAATRRHSFPISSHLLGHWTPPTPLYSSVPSQQIS